jgi:hypothetical protein
MSILLRLHYCSSRFLNRISGSAGNLITLSKGSEAVSKQADTEVLDFLSDLSEGQKKKLKRYPRGFALVLQFCVPECIQQPHHHMDPVKTQSDDKMYVCMYAALLTHHYVAYAQNKSIRANRRCG